MIKTVLILVLLVGGLVAVVRVRPGGQLLPKPARRLRILGAVAVVSALVLTVWACTFRIGAKQYGVLTTFGHPSPHDYGSGLHFKAPWQKDTEVDGRVHTDKYSQGGEYSCISVVIGNGTPSCVNATIRWQVNENQASVLYANYGTGDPTEHFRQAVIDAQFLQVVPIVLRTYNPITQLKVINGKATGRSAEVASFAPDYDALSKQAQTLMQQRLGSSPPATIQSVTIYGVPLDNATQQKLSQFIQEQAKTRTALQAIQTNRNVAKANRELENSLQRSPGILVSKCLDITADAIQSKYEFNAGWSCFGSSSVVIPGTSTPTTKPAQ